MVIKDILETVGDRLHAGATAKSVYGDPVTAGDRVIIPVARISYAFGGGAGHGSKNSDEHGGGGGGGGRLNAYPAGIIEVSPAGTTFLAISDKRALTSAFLAGLAVGAFLGLRRRSSHKG